MRRLCALLVLVATACAEDPTLDQLIDASQLIVTGKVLEVRDSVEADRKLALVEVSHTCATMGELAKNSLRGKLFVSFASATHDKSAKGALDSGKEYLLFLERRAAHGEFYGVLDGAGVEPLQEKRLQEVTRFCDEIPVCSNEHREVKSDGKDGTCASCKRKTSGSAFGRCRGCAFQEKKCRVCGKGFREPLLGDLPLIMVRRKPAPIEVEENPPGQVLLAAGQDSAAIPAGGVVGLWKFEDEEPVLEFEGDACEVLHFEDGSGRLWSGVRALKKGKVRIKVYAAERDTETWLARVVDLTLE